MSLSTGQQQTIPQQPFAIRKERGLRTSLQNARYRVGNQFILILILFSFIQFRFVLKLRYFVQSIEMLARSPKYVGKDGWDVPENVTVGEDTSSVASGSGLLTREPDQMGKMIIQEMQKSNAQVIANQATMMHNQEEMKKNQEKLIQLMTPGQNRKKRAAPSSISRASAPSTVKKAKQSERTHVSSQRHVERHNEKTKLDAESKKRENARKILI